MCIKVTERYSLCRCIYYSHAVDTCPAYGRRGHLIRTKEVLVGYTCSKHDSAHFITSTREATLNSEDSQVRKKSTEHEDRLERTAVKAIVDSPLRTRLLEKTQKVLETEDRFISVGELDEVLNGRAIAGELQSHGLADISDDVFHRLKKVFAILLVIGKLETLPNLIKGGLRDEALPLAISVTGSLADENLHSAFSDWDIDARKQFVDFQWTLLAPIFSEGKHLKLDDDTPLPFIRTEPIASGAFGSVHRVEIHRDHERFNKFESPDTKKNHVFALKQFTQDLEDASPRAFHRELTIMKSIGTSGHSHIMRSLATFEQSGRFSMVLPLAQENLRQFWARQKPYLMAQQCFEQMLGIATALSFLHNDIVTQDQGPVIGSHMDLKPENILVFKDSSSSKFMWKISDFGTSYLQPKGLHLRLPPHPGLGTYEPPECQLRLPQSQACDIWSFGCILMECAVWLMAGSNALDAFLEDRLNDSTVSGNNFRDDYYFYLQSNESNFGAITRPAVMKWIQDLDRRTTCTKAISGLLQLIKNELLQVDPRKRLNASDLSQRLKVLTMMGQNLSSEATSIMHTPKK